MSEQKICPLLLYIEDLKEAGEEEKEAVKDGFAGVVNIEAQRRLMAELAKLNS